MDPSGVPGAQQPIPAESPCSLLKALGGRIQIHNGGLSLLFDKATALESLISKLRSDSAKAAIEEVLAVVKGLRASKEEVSKAYNVAYGSVKSASENQTPAPTQTQKCDAETQSPCWWDIVPQGDTAGERGDRGSKSWTEVVKKTKRGRTDREEDATAVKQVEVPMKANRAEPRAVAGTRRTNQKNPPMKRKPPALLVRVKEGDYKNVLQKVRNSDEIKVVADKITALTKTKSGDLLVRVNPGQEGMAPLAEALGAAVGGNELVKELVQYQKVVIQDLDELASEAEVLEAIATATDGTAGEAKVVTTIAANRGQKWMVVSLPTKAASIAHASGKLRVGYVNCRVRQWEERGRGRCPRCLVAHGHTRDCKGPNRRDCCRACGATGHFEAGCGASEKDKATFRAQLTVDRSPTAGNPSQQ